MGFLLLIAGLASGAMAPEPLHYRVVTVSLPALAPRDPELGRLLEWTAGLEPGLLAVSAEPCAEALLVAAGQPEGELPLAPEVASDLLALGRYHQAVDAAREAPVRPADLARALRDPSLARELAELFARVHAASEVFDPALRRAALFEPGGVAFLEGPRGAERLRLVEAVDPVQGLARELLEARREPRRIPALLARNLLHTLALDAHGLLRAALERHPPDGPWDERAQRSLDLALATVAANTADSYGLDEETLAEAIRRARPRGRYLGLWHGHPGLRGGEPPSDEDREAARLWGRFLTLVERPEGVLVHDVRREEPRPAPVLVPYPAGR